MLQARMSVCITEAPVPMAWDQDKGMQGQVLRVLRVLSLCRWPGNRVGGRLGAEVGGGKHCGGGQEMQWQEWVEHGVWEAAEGRIA